MQIFIEPLWPAPKTIKAYTTLRHGGVSPSPYAAFNLGENTGDNQLNIKENRNILKNALQLPVEPIWIRQIHGTKVLPAIPQNRETEADATYSTEIDQVCVVLTADCLPILLCDQKGQYVAAIHAGWRGLSQGIIGNTLSTAPSPPSEILAWFGPAISQKHFEVGNEVREIFIQRDPEAIHAFQPSPSGRWMGDLYHLARLQLQKLGVDNIFGGEFCTFAQKEQFYSYRRDDQKTGRMASLIWRSP